MRSYQIWRRHASRLLGYSALLLATALTACSDTTLTGAHAAPRSPQFSLLPDIFTWLSPLGNGSPNPTRFDANAAPEVTICQWVAGSCSGPNVADFTTTATGANQIVVNSAVGDYEANWNLLNTAFTTRRTYRIRVLRSRTEVGAVSVDVVRGRWALTSSDGTLAPLASASSLPIRFAFSNPVVEVAQSIGASGGSIVLDDGGRIDVPPGTLGGPVQFDFADTENVVSHYTALSDHGYNLTITVPPTTTVGTGSLTVTIPTSVTAPAGTALYVRAWVFNLSQEYWTAATVGAGGSVQFTISAQGLGEIRDILPNHTLHISLVPEAFGSTVVTNQSVRKPGIRKQDASSQQIDQCRALPDVRPTFAIPCNQTVLRQPNLLGIRQATPGDVAIVLVHGWSKDENNGDDFLNSEGIPSCTTDVLGEQSCTTATPSLPGEVYFSNLLPVLINAIANTAPIYVFSYQSYRAFQTSGDSLAGHILSEQKAKSLSGVIFVGHSMGGLVARRATDSLNKVAPGLVRGIVTLATPHHGSPLAVIDVGLTYGKTLFGFLGNLPTPGLMSLEPPGLPDATPVPIYALGGDLTTRVFAGTTSLEETLGFDLVCAALGSPTGVDNCAHGANDEVVPISSALPSTEGFLKDTVRFARDHNEMKDGYPAPMTANDQVFVSMLSAVNTLLGKPDLSGTSLAAPAGASVGAQIAASLTVRNTGGLPAQGGWKARLYLSTDGVITNSDIQIGELTITSATPPGGTQTISIGGVVPGGMTPGAYYVGAILDANNDVSETNEANNSVATTSQTTITPANSNGLVAWYPLDGNASDASGYNNSGTNNGAIAIADRFGHANSAMQFDGSSQYMDIPSNPILKGLTNAMTVVVWMKRGTSSLSSPSIPIGRRENGNRIHFELYLENAHGITLQCCSSGGSAPGTQYQPVGTDYGTLNDGQWHQVAATRQFGAGGSTSLYIDGQLVNAQYISGSADAVSDAIDAELLLGKQASSSPGYFNGALDDLRIYNRVLSQTEIQALRDADPTGAPFSLMPSNTTVRLNQVWAPSASSSDVFVTGDGGVMKRLVSGAFQDFGSNTSAVLYSIWGTSSSNLHVSGQFHLLRAFDGANWTNETSDAMPGGFYRLWGVSASDIFAVGDYGGIYRFNGSTWTRMNSGLPSTEPNTYLQGIWGFSNTDVFVAGKAGRIGHFDGASWTMSTVAAADLYAVWGTSHSNMYAVGLSGTALHYDGTTWTSFSLGGATELHGVWGRSASDVYVVGSAGNVWHYDGSTWTKISTPTTQDLNWVWGNDTGTYIVGYNGVILFRPR